MSTAHTLPQRWGMQASLPSPFRLLLFPRVSASCAFLTVCKCKGLRSGIAVDANCGECLGVQVIVWVAVAVLSVLIVASRKHYSVDVLIAWYVVPLVFWTLHRRWTTKRNISDGVILGDAAYLGSNIESAAELQVCCLHTP